MTRPRFTLIELLVVIAIIGILASILLPALNRAAREVRFTACMNNQRQVALSLRLYADDHDDSMPSPWNIGYHMRMRDIWDPGNSCRAMGLAVFYSTRYLATPEVALCPDSPIPALGGNVNVPGSLKYVYANGQFHSNNGLYGMDSSYWVQTACNVEYTGAGQHANVWGNYVDYYYQWGIASKLEGNLPGGKLWHAGNQVLARLRSPRPIILCGTPNQYWAFRPHALYGYNVMFADGIVVRVKFTPPMISALALQGPLNIFRDFATGTYPGYLRPN